MQKPANVLGEATRWTFKGDEQGHSLCRWCRAVIVEILLATHFVATIIRIPSLTSDTSGSHRGCQKFAAGQS